jgi:hypothetical protein
MQEVQTQLPFKIQVADHDALNRLYASALIKPFVNRRTATSNSKYNQGNVNNISKSDRKALKELSA